MMTKLGKDKLLESMSINDPAPDLELDKMAVTHDHLLQGAIAVTQPKSGFRVGTDAIFLAASVAMDKGRVLDLGAGVGGVCLCLAQRLEAIKITAIELDPIMAALAEKNAAANGFSQRLRVLNADIAKMPPVLAASFDHVVSNPPYNYAAGTRPSDRLRALAHMGDGDALGDWVTAALWAAKPRGRISFICRADRGAELIHLFTAAGAGEILQFALWPRPMVPAGRVIITARKGVAGPGAILPGLVVHNDDGGFTTEATAILKGAGLAMIHPARRKRPQTATDGQG